MGNPMWEVVKGKWAVPKDTRPSMKGRTVIVTGANVGLGFEASAKLVELGAEKVILGVRTLSKGEDARKQIEARTGRSGAIEVWHLDMLDYATIKAFADRATNELPRLDYAILNAGVAKMEFEKSQYGHEQTMQVNALSTALLALLLTPKLRSSKTADFTPVLEIVGSGNHFIVTQLKSESEPLAAYDKDEEWNGLTWYSVSKLFVMYIETALARLAKSKDDDSPDFYVVTVCPGATVSEIAREADSWYMKIGLTLFRVLLQRKTEEGARTYISALTLGEKGHGKFWKDDEIKEEAPLIAGEKGKELQQKVWKEIVEALEKDVPQVEQLVHL